MVKRDKKLSLFFYPDIYNKLYIMIKQTWEVSNEERNRILLFSTFIKVKVNFTFKTLYK